MAYQADIRISVKGGKQIEQLSNAAELLTPVIEEANQAFKTFGDLQNQNLPLLRNFNRVLQENRKAFNDAVLGTREATTAAQALVQAERAVNGELERRNTLLNAVRVRDAGGFGPKQADPAQKVAAQKLQAKDEQALQNALLEMERKKQQAFEDTFKLKGQSVNIEGRSLKILDEKQDLQQKLSQMQQRDNKLRGQSVNIEQRLQKIISEEKSLQDALFKLEQKSTRELEEKFLLRRKNKNQLDDEIRKVKSLRQAEITEAVAQVEQTKQQVANEIKINASRRERMIMNNQELQFEIKLNRILDQRRAKEINDRAISNALIGGAFPLLFGQGLGASVGGAAGGFAGGKKGGQFGFALSLLGTVLGSQLDNLAKKARELGEALREPVKNIDTLVKAIGQSNTPFGDTINTLKRLGLEGVAANEVLNRFNRTFNTNRSSLTELGEESIRLNNELAKLGTSITLFIAGPLAKLIETINDTLGNQTIKGIKRDAGLEAFNLGMEKFAPNTPKVLANLQAKQNFFGKKIDGQTFDEFRKSIEPGIFETKMNEAGLGGQAGTKDFANEDLQKLIQGRREFELSVLRSNLAIEKQSLTTRKEDLEVLKRRIDSQKLQEQITIKQKNLASLQTDEAKAQAQFELDKLIVQKQISDELLRQSIILANPIDAELIKLNNAIRDINDSQLQAVNLSKTMASSFEESFKGIVSGTMSVEQAFGNMLNKIADHFLNLAAKLMASKLQQGILGLLTKGIGGGGSNFGQFDLGLNSGSDFMNMPQLFKFADGGRPPVNRPSIVGEKGPELFVPRSSGNIIPNNKLGGGNTNNVVVNVDASGSDVQGDEAAAKEIGTLISVAVQGELLKQQRPGGLLSR